MPLVFLVIGIGLVVTAIRGTYGLTQSSGPSKGQPGLLGLLQKDFTGPGNFGIWIVAVAALGAIGTIPGFKTTANGLLVLVVLGILLSNRGFFTQFQQAVSAT